ncbi:MAG TPA: hypothetical protein VD731_04565 [Nitrosopumilaceae archaeon]|nr:hypothetical protein [Nitrosopumilaceae archaeon]
MEEWIIPVLAIGLVMIGLIGQAFQMRKIRSTTKNNEELGSPKIFLDKRNYKWYILIGSGLVFWYSTEGLP